MAENDTSQERTEEPTPKRLDDARKKGQVPRSRELSMTLVMLVGAISLLFLGKRLAAGMAEVMRTGFGFDPSLIARQDAVVGYFVDQVMTAIVMLAPLMIILMVTAIMAPATTGGWNFSVQALQPKLERLDPLKGLKRVFGPKGLMELLKTLGKFLVVGIAAAILISSLAERFAGLSALDSVPAMAEATSMVGFALIVLSAVLIIIAAVDVPFQLYQHTKQLKMTRQEVRDEMKQTEGKPEVKAKIRQLQQEVASRRMMEDVPRADVVITNPTHFAVALRYEAGQMDAPVVVAKGADLVAAAIRRVAEENDVPLLEAPPLARALFHAADIGQAIPAGLYVAVAEVLSWVYQIRRLSGSGHEPSPPDIELDEAEWVPKRFRGGDGRGGARAPST
ncbi:flagellar biosynthesis protein FlhB [Wenzhouxiangella limi]|uniref:Flagellar biosynthetic protein FlhB n=1 Tax=Wenzhouxiangella limi TaxID=2707351 RepID=A0A845VAK0_9GAMM|nr:flagellar biosynthesis protein FlhB [Wenzhouxiangella limi]